MRAWGQYTLAILITLTSVPMYVYIYHRSTELPQSPPDLAVKPVVLNDPAKYALAVRNARQLVKDWRTERLKLTASQRCYGGAIVEKKGSSYTSINGVDGSTAHCSNGYADRAIR